MYRLKPGIKQDPERRWALPDRVFFGFGACLILAGVYLQNPPLLGFFSESVIPGGGFLEIISTSPMATSRLIIGDM